VLSIGDIAIIRNGFAFGATADFVSIAMMEKTFVSSSAMQRVKNHDARAEDEKIEIPAEKHQKNKKMAV